MTESKPMDYLDRLPTVTTEPEITSTSSTCTSNRLTTPPQSIQTQLTQQIAPAVPTTRDMPSMYLLDLYQKNSSNINTIASTDDPDLPVGVELIPCPICNRTFNPNTLQKHVGICEKMATKKRNVFDSSRQRREGTELAIYPLPKNFTTPTGNNASSVMTTSIIRGDRGQSPKPHKIDSPILARKKSQDEFVRTTSRTSMRKRSNSASNTSRVSTTPANTHVNISGINNESQTNLVMHPITFTRDRMRSSERSLITKRIQPPPAEQCPHCERCFGIKAYDRHVEWCKEKALQAAIKQNSKNDQNIAKERLEARTKYRAPCLKTKRSINRDKYSGFTPDENDPATDSPKSSNSKNLMSLSMTSSITSDRNVTISGIIEAAKTKTKTYTNKMEHHSANSPTEDDIQPQGTFDSQQGPRHDFHLMGQQLEAYDHKKSITKDQQQPQKLRETMVPTKNDNGFGNSNSNSNRAKNTNLIHTKKTSTEEKRREMDTAPHTQINNIVNNESNNLTKTLLLEPCNNACMHRGAEQTLIGTQPNANSTEKRKSKNRQQPCINQMHAELMHQQTQQKHNSYQTEQNELQPKTTLESSANENSLSEFMPQGQPGNAEQSIYKASQSVQLNKKTAITSTAKPSITTAILNTKLDTNPIKATPLCRPKRKKLSRTSSITTNTAPLKAIPLLNESIEKLSSCTSDVSSQLNYNRYDDKQIKIIKAPIRVRSSTPPPPLTRNKSFILSGIPCNYDPFLSAKRQLEELCLPIPSTDTLIHNVTASESTPSTPCINVTLPSKMTTSLTLNISTSQSSPLTQNNSHNRLNNALTSTPSCKTPISSNFRRTSSLRGSRRSPMLSSRPLFAQKHRPTIQRGLSDEGPISTNFLKPEEYDEMPVRSVCVNDFAISNSPRVVRRDTSSSNRKPNVTANTSREIATTNMPLINATNKTDSAIKKGNSSDERVTENSKHCSKTDSLAVFLKYENELEQLPITNAKSINTHQPSKICNSIVPQVSDFESPVITKELKDKSNNLSKQNSTKSIKQISLDEEQTEVQKPKSSNSRTLLPTPVSQQQNLLEFPKQDSSSNTNFTKNTTLHLEPISNPNTQSTTTSSKYKPNCNEAFSSSSKELPPMINLNAIFGTCKLTEPSTVLNKKTQNLSHTEYIDPKLINKCDNLPVNLNKYFTHKTTDSNSSDSEPHLDISSHPTDISTNSTDTAFIPVSQQSKLPQHSKYNESFVKLHSVYANETRPVNVHSTDSCNISEGRNVLKRKMRLGRNQFLYDASPEPEYYTTNDNFNRLSTKSINQQPNQKSKSIPSTPQSQTQTSHQELTVRQKPPQLLLPTPLVNIPPMPTFDNFNFEEFLSSFVHDDEQFPLFKDCREFLLNRTSSKQRSTLTSNSNKGSVNDCKHQSRQSPITSTHFQFPNVHINNNPLQTSAVSPSSSPSSFFLRSRNNCNIIDREPGQNATDNGRNSPVHEFNKSQTVCDEPSGSNEDHKKREIFISIETEQNDLERSPISPNSLRNMVGNPQTMVEVEIDATDNKFSRISDDEPMPRTPSPFNTLAREDLPNVQLNNAKNLIQKMQDDFRQMSEGVGENLRQVVNTCSSHRSSATGTPRSVSTTAATTTTQETANTIPSGDAGMESDDMSSLDGYPILSQSSRRGVSSKLSADSAYGSLSRQRTLDTSTHRNSSRAHSSTINMVTNTSLPTTIGTQNQQQQPQQHQQQQLLHSKQSQTATPYNKYNSTKNRARQRSGSSSSGSDNSLPPISHTNRNLNLATCNTAYQQQLSQIYSNNNMNNNCDSPLSSPTTNLPVTNGTTIQRNDPNANHSRSNSISNSNSNLKMSKFCHECGGKFIIENAKFCTDCGVRRIIL